MGYAGIVLAGGPHGVCPEWTSRPCGSAACRCCGGLSTPCRALGRWWSSGPRGRGFLLGAWRTEALRNALPEQAGGASLRATLGRLSITDVPEEPGESADSDTSGGLDRFG